MCSAEEGREQPDRPRVQHKCLSSPVSFDLHSIPLQQAGGDGCLHVTGEETGVQKAELT